MKSLWKQLTALPAPDLTMVRYDTTQDHMKTSVCYQGVLHKHPYEKDAVVLITHPLTQSAMCYEFKASDITKVEDLPNIVTESGENIRMVNLWVRKGSFGLFMAAFEVSSENKDSIPLQAYSAGKPNRPG